MSTKEVIVLLQQAREYAKLNNLEEAEKAYLQTIDNLKLKADTEQGKAELWTTKAEYLLFRANFLRGDEKKENSRERFIDALRLLFRTSNLNATFKKTLDPKIKQLVNQTISIFGCILPEDEKGIHISCPIRIRNTGAGKIGFSAGMYFKQAVCSICKRDILDPECTHNVGETYNGKKCYTSHAGLTIDHVSMTENPKDPNCNITEIWFPKKDFYEGFSKEDIERKEKEKLPFVCNICKNQKNEPKEIDIVKFFKMQQLEL